MEREWDKGGWILFIHLDTIFAYLLSMIENPGPIPKMSNKKTLIIQ